MAHIELNSMEMQLDGGMNFDVWCWYDATKTGQALHFTAVITAEAIGIAMSDPLNISKAKKARAIEVLIAQQIKAKNVGLLLDAQAAILTNWDVISANTPHIYDINLNTLT
jgi:hypothetical protein